MMAASKGRVAESGLRHSTRNRAWGYTHRGFESRPFRHFQGGPDRAAQARGHSLAFPVRFCSPTRI